MVTRAMRCVGTPAVPDLQAEPRPDDGGPLWQRKVHCVASPAQGFRKVT